VLDKRHGHGLYRGIDGTIYDVSKIGTCISICTCMLISEIILF